MICYMVEYVDNDGYLDVDQLPEPLRTLYLELKDEKTPTRPWSENLRAAPGVSD
jgi:hypothetical protein